MRTKKKGLRIGVFVTSQQPHPAPPGVIWAPIDLAVEIADSLAPKGHRFTFYAPPSPGLGHRVVSGRVRQGVNTRAFLKHETRYRREHAGPRVVAMFDQYLLGEMIEDANKGKYDVLHAHMAERAVPFLRFSKVPVLITLHDPLWPLTAEAMKLFDGPDLHLVSISDSQRRPNRRLNYAATVYNGVDVAKFSFSSAPEDFFLYAGRIIPQKGVGDAILAAKAAREKLMIVGKYYDEKYFRKEVGRLLSKRVVYRREVPRDRLPSLYGKAKALLLPLKWEEPFGLVMAEAMACGTPVIAYGRGSVPEIVKDGVTGFIVRTPKEMAAAMRRIGEIDRRECRRHVERNFSLERMADGYEALYRRYARPPSSSSATRR